MRHEIDDSPTTINRIEAKYNNVIDTRQALRYGGPVNCEGCRTFNCYHGTCKEYEKC